MKIWTLYVFNGALADNGESPAIGWKALAINLRFHEACELALTMKERTGKEYCVNKR